jgi:LDH2 family malate/lactate/ureidoglycolate dehydrogenase
MAAPGEVTSKLDLDAERIRVPVAEAEALAARILRQAGFDAETAGSVAAHLVDADLCGVESHGIVRVIQYVDQVESGYLARDGEPRLLIDARGAASIDGGGGIGIPAMAMAIDRLAEDAARAGMAVLPVRNVGHTGRLGAFGESAAARGLLLVIVGGGGRQTWRQVAPYGGVKALLPTNPYCMAIPGGDRGPVVIDFATSMIAGGWLHSARAAGALVPAGAIIDATGEPSRDPQAYFDGGAILPKGGPMGYGMAVMAEMICEAMLGPVTAECNWLTLAVEVSRFRAPTAMRQAAETVLAELRDCPPAKGFARVEVPGERERALRVVNTPLGIAVPPRTLAAIEALARRLGR